jgi:hypothetical protein
MSKAFFNRVSRDEVEMIPENQDVFLFRKEVTYTTLNTRIKLYRLLGWVVFRINEKSNALPYGGP